SGGLSDGFVLKLNNLGTGLIFSTYLGGNSTDEINDIAIDSDSDIYIGGITRSANLPVSPGAYDNAYSGVDDGFVAKLSSDGSTLLYLSYLGQSSNENVKSIYVDNNKELVVTGTTSSSNFPTTSGAYSTTHNGSGDIFVSKFNIDATNLVFSTFVGGSLAENAFSIKIGGNGKIFVTGNTTSIDFPVTSNAFDVTHNGMNDIIVFCLSPTFNQLLWATYLGGTSNDYGVALDIDQNNNIIITGETKSINFPTTANAHDQTINSVLEDALVAVLDSLGETLIYSTFLGGSSVDKGTAIKHNSSDNKIYVAGYTYSSNFPTTSGAYSTTHNTSTYDFFVSKFCYRTVNFNAPTHNGPICHGDTLKLFVDTIIGVTYSWQGPNGFSSTLQNPFIPIAQQFVHNGVYSVTLTDSEGCSATKSTNTIYINRPYIYVNNDTLCDGESYHFYASTNDTYLWSGPNGFNSTQGSIFVQNITTNYSGQYTITVTYNGCTRTENFE
ncbi:MAG: SBBP repeat-containing protein, partial [Bacteroidia bacterium]